MNVSVHFYAQLRDLTGVSESVIEMPAGATVAQLLETIYQRTPSLRLHDKAILTGAGVEFVDRSYVIEPDDKISIMPPVQGG